MSTKDPREVLAEWKANSDRIDVLRDEFEDKEIAGENYAVTIVPLDVLRAIEKSECAVPALVKAVEAVQRLIDREETAIRASFPATTATKVIANGDTRVHVTLGDLRAITDALTEGDR